jgi:excisionase family DNA binding protein
MAKLKTDIITIRELSAYLRMAEKTLYRLVAAGSVPGFKVGGAWRFRLDEIEAWTRSSNKKRKNV